METKDLNESKKKRLKIITEIKDSRHLTGRKVRRYIEKADIYDYAIILYPLKDKYIVEPVEENRCEEKWLITDCEIVEQKQHEQ
jgi:hypothetical protein